MVKKMNPSLIQMSRLRRLIFAPKIRKKLGPQPHQGKRNLLDKLRINKSCKDTKRKTVPRGRSFTKSLYQKETISLMSGIKMKFILKYLLPRLDMRKIRSTEN